MASGVAIASAVATAFLPIGAAANVTRACTVTVELVHLDAGVYKMGEFTVRAGGGSPNRARRRARDRAIVCLRAHHELRAQPTEPSECTIAYGVENYPFSSARLGERTLAQVMQESFCAGRTGPQEPQMQVRVSGDNGCSSVVPLSRWPIQC